MKEIKSLVASLLPEEKQHDILTHLEDLAEIYQAEVNHDKTKFEKSTNADRQNGRKTREGARRARRSSSRSEREIE
jgi:hypothetical protein